MSKILVVDDMAIFREPIAATLRREGFETACAGDGREALHRVGQDRPNLILLDVAMPVMDGLSFLKALRSNPQTRDIPVIMLSAISERNLVLQAARAGVQEYLLKSHFSTDDLVRRVRRHLSGGDAACEQGGATRAAPDSPPDAATEGPASPSSAPCLERSKVLEHVRQHLQLRSMPAALHYVVGLTSSQTSNLDEVVGALKHDQSLALKVMKVANSSFYGAARRAQNLTEAAQRIGMSGIRNAVVAIVGIDHFADALRAGLVPQRFWEHSLASAALAQLVGETAGLKDAETLFLAGLLHDVGRMVLAQAFADTYQGVLTACEGRGIELGAAEREAFGLSHTEITREVLVQWRIPESVAEAAALHDRGIEHIRRSAREPQRALAVALADRLAHALALGDSGDSMLLPFREHAAALALDAGKIRAIAQEAAARTADMTLFFGSQSEVRFREPLRSELARMAGLQVRLAVLAEDAPADPLSLFFGHLGWVDSERPRLAVLYACSEGELAAGFEQVRRLEAAVGGPLAVLLATPPESALPPTALLQGRHWTSVRIPGRYGQLVKAVLRLRGMLARQPASVQE